MDWLHNLFATESVARTIILLGVAGGVGIALGKIKICNIGLGSAGVLFAGLILGHFKLGLDHHVLEFVREFGLILFVYTLGLQIGPGFFASLRSKGIILNFFAACIVFGGVVIAALWINSGFVDVAAGVGILSGATTNTPSLAAAGQALSEVGVPPDIAAVQGMGYAIAYPFGIIGIILTMILIRVFFRINVQQEVELAESAHSNSVPPPATRNFEVRNTNLVDTKLGEVPGLSGSNVVVSRFSRGGVVEVAKYDTRLQLGDILHAVGPEKDLNALRIVIGADAGVDLKTVQGTVINERILVTKSTVFGKPLSQISAFAQYNVVVTRVTRQGLQFSAAPNFKLQFGDVVMAVGEPANIAKIADVLGNSNKALNSPQPMPFFFGIALGVLVGSIPLAIPGLPAAVKLGLAGGPLVVAILLSRLISTGPLVWHMPHNANHMLREIGITMFLAAVGIKSGDRFMEVLLGTEGLRWLLIGATITIIPLLAVGFLARFWKKTNYAELAGMLAGSMTDPPALAFAHQSTGSDAPGVAYATVYPLTMLLRIFTAQLLVFILYKAAGG